MSGSTRELGKHAIVIGGSMGGLLTARVLRDFFPRVTILERDACPESSEPRKGVPQGRHVHVLFDGGVRVIERLFPGFFEELSARGAVVCNASQDLCWFHGGVWKARPESELVSYWQTRPFLESNLRRRLKSDPDVRILDQRAVTGLLASEDRTRVIGVEVRNAENVGATERLEADLVVDACGRGSQTPRWLESLGYRGPDETKVEVNVGYASRIYEPSPQGSRDWQVMLVFGTPPTGTRNGYIFPIEGGRWLVSLNGFLKDFPPDDDQGFLEYARSLELPDFYAALQDAKPLSDISSFKFPASRWRRYDQLSRFPSGLLVIGDAISSFNPAYGQGMSVCALEVEKMRLLLEACCRGGGISDDFAQTFFRQAAKTIAIPWMLASQSDFRYPQMRGKRPLYCRPLNWYLGRVMQLCSGNDRIVTIFYEVLHLVKKPAALFHPAVVLQVLGRSVGLKGSFRPTKERPRLAA